MPEYNSLKHASHNENACTHLTDTGYNDWIITTAFYSSMHYLRHRIFPIDVKKDNQIISVKTFDDYCVSNDQTGRKHNTMRKLVEEHCPSDIASAYNQMLDTSWTARYSHYQFSHKVAQLAKRRLVAIKNYSTRQSIIQ